MKKKNMLNRVILVGFPIESYFDTCFPLCSIFCANSFIAVWNPLSVALLKVHSDFPLVSIAPHNRISRSGPKDALFPNQHISGLESQALLQVNTNAVAQSEMDSPLPCDLMKRFSASSFVKS